MTPRERVHAALRREPTDRVPVFMWFHPATITGLAAELDVPVGALDEVMGNDVAQTWVNNNYAMEGVVHEREGEGHTDAWGIRWERGGAFNQIVHHPLAGEEEEALLAYRFPDEALEDLLGQMEPVAAGRGERFLGCDVSPCVFEYYTRLRGMEDALADLLGHPETAATLLGRCAAFSVRLAEAACERYPLDWLWTGDDVASQQSMLMSPDCWRELVKPRLREVVEVGKRRGLWVAYHSCGAIRPILPDLIEIGVDVLNPVQVGCPGMDPLSLKEEFGGRIAFMGGVDTQGLLPAGTAQEVRDATRRLLEGMTADGGGYILAASHTIPPETPMENIFAMYEVAGLSEEEIRDRAAAARAAG